MIMNYIGIFINLVGSLLLAFSVSKNPSGAFQMIGKKKIPLAVIYGNRFRWGICFLIVGFVLQFVSAIISI